MPVTHHNSDPSKKVKPSLDQIEDAINKIRRTPITKDVELSDDILIGLLEYYSIPRGPIVGSTRDVYKRLISKRIREQTQNQLRNSPFAKAAPSGGDHNTGNSAQAAASSSINQNTNHAYFNRLITPRIKQIDEEEEDEDEEDEDDQDYKGEDDDEELENYDDDDDDDEREEDEDTEDSEDLENAPDEEDSEALLEELSDDDTQHPMLRRSNTSHINDSKSGRIYRAISKTIVMTILSLFTAASLTYFYWSTNLTSQLTTQIQQLIRLSFVILAFSPVGYIIYKVFRFYRKRCDEDTERVNNLVSDALEILQSPSEPKGLIPVLHIRDTLLTPAERKSKQTIQLWNKAVKFIEKHESRVKIEMANIDGEDFRAWKWIGMKRTKVN